MEKNTTEDEKKRPANFFHYSFKQNKVLTMRILKRLATYYLNTV